MCGSAVMHSEGPKAFSAEPSFVDDGEAIASVADHQIALLLETKSPDMTARDARVSLASIELPAEATHLTAKPPRSDHQRTGSFQSLSTVSQANVSHKALQGHIDAEKVYDSHPTGVADSLSSSFRRSSAETGHSEADVALPSGIGPASRASSSGHRSVSSDTADALTVEQGRLSSAQLAGADNSASRAPSRTNSVVSKSGDGSFREGEDNPSKSQSAAQQSTAGHEPADAIGTPADAIANPAELIDTPADAIGIPAVSSAAECSRDSEDAVIVAGPEAVTSALDASASDSTAGQDARSKSGLQSTSRSSSAVSCPHSAAHDLPAAEMHRSSRGSSSSRASTSSHAPSPRHSQTAFAALTGKQGDASMSTGDQSPIGDAQAEGNMSAHLEGSMAASLEGKATANTEGNIAAYVDSNVAASPDGNVADNSNGNVSAHPKGSMGADLAGSPVGASLSQLGKQGGAGVIRHSVILTSLDPLDQWLYTQPGMLPVLDYNKIKAELQVSHAVSCLCQSLLSLHRRSPFDDSVDLPTGNADSSTCKLRIIACCLVPQTMSSCSDNHQKIRFFPLPCLFY